MANVLISMSPEPGHIIPTLRLATQLRDAGHRVFYQTTDAMRGPMTRMGFETFPLYRGYRLNSENRSLPENRQASRQILARVTLEASLRGKSLAEVLREELLEAGSACEADLYITDALHSVEYGGAFHTTEIANRMITLITLLPRPNFNPGAPVWTLCPEALETPENRRSIRRDRVNYGGPQLFLLPAGGGFDWSQVDSGAKLIGCSFGTQNIDYPGLVQQFDAIVEACQHSGLFLILAIGSHPDRQLLAARYRRFVHVLAVSSIPQWEVLDRVSVMIHHGGLGTIKECIWKEVPFLVIPQKYDQPHNAERVRYHGLGRVLDPQEVRPDNVEHALHSLLGDPGYKDRLKAMRCIFEEQDRCDPLAHTCLEYLAAVPA